MCDVHIRAQAGIEQLGRPAARRRPDHTSKRQLRMAAGKGCSNMYRTCSAKDDTAVGEGSHAGSYAAKVADRTFCVPPLLLLMRALRAARPRCMHLSLRDIRLNSVESCCGSSVARLLLRPRPSATSLTALSSSRSVPSGPARPSPRLQLKCVQSNSQTCLFTHVQKPEHLHEPFALRVSIG